MEGRLKCESHCRSRGYNIGVRLIDEFLARSGVPRCQKDIKETADVIAKVSSLCSLWPYFAGGIPHVLERNRQRLALERR